jgi:hypothetical protein
MDKKRENNKFDFSTVIANVDKVKAAKAAKQKKPSTSVKPLKFDPHPEDSPLKAAIVERINAKNLTYSEIYNYCTDLKGGDVLEGQKLGYNIISGLKNRHTMIDTTFSMLCDFLGYDIMLVERKKEDEED